MKEFYVTNTECAMESGRTEYRLYGRTEAGNAVSTAVEGYDQYFYVRPEEAAEVSTLDHDYLEGFEETEFRDLREQEPLTKVIVNHPWKVEEVAGIFDETWDADVDPTNRFRRDTGLKTGVRVPNRDQVYVTEMEPINMEAPTRVMTFDIETDDRGEGFPSYGEARILSIVAHDSFTDEYVGFIDMENTPIEERFPDVDFNKVDNPSDLGLKHLDQLNFEPDEKRMLVQFYNWVSERDFDVIAGWNSNGFDTPFVIERAEKVDATADRMGRGGGCGLDWRDDPYINGRSCFDLMEGWKDTKFTKVSGALENAAEMELEDAKIEHQDKGFYELYRDNTRKFLNYNAKDTFLTVGVNQAANVIGFKTALRNTIGLDFEDTGYNKDFITMMVRRELHERKLVGPTADPPEDAESFDGAFVFPAFEGLKENIVGIDLSSLYPNTLWMLNASPETKLGKIGRDFKESWLDRIEAEGYDVAVSSNGVVFCCEEDGIFRKLVDEALELKAEAGRKMADDSLSAEEQENWAEEYAVRKTIVNSIYGVLGWVRFFLYDKDIASAVTLTGQEVIKTTAEYVNSDKTPASVAYGDTDSNYIEFPSEWNQERCLKEANTICANLNGTWYPRFAEDHRMSMDPCRFEIELEMYAPRFFMSGQKKFYAYSKAWKEGMDFDATLKDGDGKISISGYPCIKANTAPLTKQVQKDTLEGIVRGMSKEDIRQIIRDGAMEIDPQNPDFDKIGIPGGLGQSLGEYDWTDGSPKGASPRAAYFGNLFVPEVNFGEDDTVKRIYLTGQPAEYQDRTYRLDVIGFERGAQLEAFKGELEIDVPRMQDTLIRNPMEEILDAVNIDVDAAIQGQSQSGLAAFV